MAKKKRAQRTRSAYQAYIRATVDESIKNVIDLTECKLRRLAKLHPDEDVRKLAERMLVDYKSGTIAIAWENGTIPVYCFLKS